jgi:hypothetical protein
MPIFCNSIKKVLVALAREPGQVYRPARHDCTGSHIAGKLRGDRGAAVAFERHFAFSALAARAQRNYNRCKGEKNPVFGETHQF